MVEADIKIARIETDKVQDEIVRQVVVAFARLQSQSAQIGVGIVLENIQAEQDLTRARDDYLSVIARYNKAQYELLRALGAIDHGVGR